MGIGEFYSRMRQEISGYSNQGREETSAFLIWFLINYFRMESTDAIDSVCDHTNDKGIDGIVVDEEEETIYLFQSKFSPSDTQDQGDNDLRNFMGARTWFQSEETIQNLINSTAHHELKSLVQRKGILDKISFNLVSVFVTNKHFNEHALEYIPTDTNLEAYDSNKLFKEKRDMEKGFKDSGLQLNKNLANLDKWTENEITDRAERLAEKALKIWHI